MFHLLKPVFLLSVFMAISTNRVKAQIVESKTFSPTGRTLHVLVESSPTGNFPYEIWVVEEILSFDNPGYDGIVTAFNKVHYDVYDDTAKLVTQYDYKHIQLHATYDDEGEGEWEYVTELHSPVCDYVEQMIAKYDTGIKIEHRNYSQKLSHHADLSDVLFSDRPSTNWMQETELSYTVRYGAIYNSGDIETEDGPYRVYMHNTDGNDKNFEAVSVVKADGTIRLRVASVIAFILGKDGYMESDYKENIYRIDMVDPEGRYYVICNKELWETLVKLAQTTDFNNAYHLMDRRAVIHDANPISGRVENLHVFNPN